MAGSEDVTAKPKSFVIIVFWDIRFFVRCAIPDPGEEHAERRCRGV